MTATNKPKTDYASGEFFPISSAVDILSRATQDHCPSAFDVASNFLSTAPSSLMRGAAYLGWLLAQVPEEERNPEAEYSAQSALAEMSALAAVLIEIQDRADIQRFVREQARTA